MTQQPPTAPLDRPVVGSYPTYEGAQRAVDFLSDSKFPVEHTAIIGSDLRMVETVLGRLTRGRAALAGAGSGAWFGLLVGLLLSLFAAGNHHVLVLMISGLFYGAIFGALSDAAGARYALLLGAAGCLCAAVLGSRPTRAAAAHPAPPTPGC
ncbi:general stress protein [Streptomyces sp. NPDC001980]|uniref:general stress protein n=1 Tax=Streptomyces sp. NPDC001980 TaxID=3157126 RepID=UPI0033250B90